MTDFIKPDYCTSTKGTPWCANYPPKVNYKGKYYRSECTHCWLNSLRSIRVYNKNITIRKNTTTHTCPICNAKFDKKEYTVDLGFSGSHVLVHIGCLNKFIDNLILFRDNKLPMLLSTLVAKEL